ncbi:MAG: DUF1893 domain-containing protein [Clostridia bacterium]|nr:DUF1893 domain-containing protein [Clostridia bacterium]
MNADTLKAKEILNEGDFTLVFCQGHNIITSADRGVSPLMKLLEDGKDYSDYSAADKVVGGAAAYLYVLLGIKEVYALTLSERARLVFEKYGILYFSCRLVPYIVNRKGDGPCPMEEATKNATDPEDALRRIREKLIKMKNGN